MALLQCATQTVPCYCAASPQHTAAEPAVIESLQPSRALSDPGSDGVLMGKANEFKNGVYFKDAVSAQQTAYRNDR